jgi:predicted transcriptional regulator
MAVYRHSIRSPTKDCSMDKNQNGPDFISLAAEIVSAYVGKNAIQPSELPNVIGQVHLALSGLAKPPAPVVEALAPPVKIKKTITPDYLISLEDGKRYQSLKRHLTVYGLTPDEYRAKWGLPRDYPMVSAKYSARRAELARTIGLGRKPKAAIEAPVPPTPKMRKPRAKKAVPAVAE